jgi:hypothetical protein
MKLRLGREWELGPLIGSGGFGKVYEARSGADECVAKFIPKDPGAERELLFADVGDSEHVVPIIDSGETDDHWVLIMPRAEKSLRDHLDAAGGPLGVREGVAILLDIATGLAELAGRVVHRDLKPDNVLLLGGRWRLADFGIARYADAATATHTKKFDGSPPYVAPERWRQQRATSATDVYSLGVIAHELFSGSPPFTGQEVSEFREQHLHSDPPPLQGVPPALDALIVACLFKAPEARPSARRVVERLRGLAPAPTPGLAALQEAHLAEVRRSAQESSRRSEAHSEVERRVDLLSAAERTLSRIADALRAAILEAAPSTGIEQLASGQTILTLGNAKLVFGGSMAVGLGGWGDWPTPAFTVIAHSEIVLEFPPTMRGYTGRSHSLWYCDAQEEGSFRWFEIAFAPAVDRRYPGSRSPGALPPGEIAAQALWGQVSEYRVAWSFTPVEIDELDGFVDRWAGWFAQAALGRLERPTSGGGNTR